MSEKVQVIIFFQDTNHLEVLLLQTNNQRGAFWQNITGSVEMNDSNLSYAAIREAKEETGINLPSVIQLNHSFEYHNSIRNINYKEYIFYSVLNEKPIVQLSNEHQNYCWKNVLEVNQPDFKFESNYIGFCEALKQVKTK